MFNSKINFKNFNSKVLIKNLVFSAIIYIIPIIILIFIVNNNTVKLFQNEIVISGQNNLKKSMENIENNFSIINNTALNMSRNEALSVFKLRNNYYEYSEVVSELREYLYQNNFTKDILYYIRGAKDIYSAFSYDTLDEFFEGYAFEFNKNELMNIINNTSMPIVLSAQNVSKYNVASNVIIYVLPIPQTLPYATGVFIVDNNWVYSQLKYTFDKNTANTYIVDSSNNIITQAEITKTNGIELASIIRNFYGDDYYYETNNNVVIGMKSEKTGWKYISVLEKKAIFQKIIQIRNGIILWSAILFVFGFILIMYISYYSYMPIYKLRSIFASEGGNDDFNIINKGIETIKEDNEKMKVIIKEHNQRLKTMFLNEIIWVKKKKRNSDYIANVDFDLLENNSFRIVIFRINNKNSINESLKLFSNIAQYFENLGMKIHNIESEYEDAFVFLIEYNSELEDEIYKYSTNQIFNECTLIIGIKCSDLLDIKDSYISAVTEYEKRNYQSVIFAKSDNYKIENYPYEQMIMLKDGLNKKRLSIIQASLDNLRDFVKNSLANHFVKKCVIFDMVNLLVKNIHSFKNNNDGFEYLLDSFALEGDVLIMSDEIFNAISEYFVGLFTEKKDSIYEFVSKVCDFIKNTYADYNLSVTAVSDKFNVSTTYLNQKFKDEIGESVYDYISRIRLDEAKRLLEDTEIPIKEIVEKVGYIDVSSFGRKFKSQFGLTPSEYRTKDIL